MVKPAVKLPRAFYFKRSIIPCFLLPVSSFLTLPRGFKPQQASPSYSLLSRPVPAKMVEHQRHVRPMPNEGRRSRRLPFFSLGEAWSQSPESAPAPSRMNWE